MKRKFTDDDAREFTGAMGFLESYWGIRTHYEIDLNTGRAVVELWLPGSEAVVHLEGVDCRRIRVVERNRQRFPDRGNDGPDRGNEQTPTGETR